MLVPVSTHGMVVWFFTCLLFFYFLCFAILIGFPSLGVVSFCVLYTESLWISEFEKASVQILCSLYIIIQTWINSQNKVTLDSFIWQAKKWIKIYDPYYVPFSILVLFNWIVVYV
jgi:hypothetical protein